MSPHLALLPGERLRAGSQVLRTLYAHTGDHKGRLIGMVDTPEMAELVVTAVNAWLDGQQNATDGNDAG
jgi:hypothetical protein